MASTPTKRRILPLLVPLRYVTCSVLPSSATLINESLLRQGRAQGQVGFCALDFEILDHFQNQTCSTMAGATVQRVYRDELLKIAVNVC
jgi:hypothetical protein